MKIKNNIEKNVDIKAQFEIIYEAIFEKKGEKIVNIDLTKKNLLMDYFIIAESDNEMKAQAIADNVIEKLREKANVKPYRVEGYENAQWILIDYIDYVVHIFIDRVRYHYSLETLWSSCPQIKIEDKVIV